MRLSTIVAGLQLFLVIANWWSFSEAFTTTTTTTNTRMPPVQRWIPLQVSTVVDSSSSSSLRLVKPLGWRQRVFRRVFRRRNNPNNGRLKPSSSSSSNNGSTRAAAVAIAHEAYAYDELAIAQQYHEQQQQRRKWFLAVFKSQHRPLLELSITTSTAASTRVAPTVPRDTRLFYAKWIEWGVERNLHTRLDRWTDGMHTNLKISCDLQSPPLHVIAGTITANIHLTADRLLFGAFSCSGGSLTANAISVNLLSFTKLGKTRFPRNNSYRYPKAFEFHIDRLMMTQRDLLESTCIRNGLRRLLTRILRESLLRKLKFASNASTSTTTTTTGRGVSVDIRHIDIVSNKVIIRGVAITPLALMSIPFVVKTQLGVSGRGHILTFPNLEIVISNLRLPLANVSVDLGHNAQLHRIDTSTDHQLKLSATVRITPDHTRITALSPYQQCTASFGSVAFVDVGQWLTRLGRFSG